MNVESESDLETIKLEIEQTITGLSNSEYKDNPNFKYPDVSVKRIDSKVLKSSTANTRNFTHEIDFQFEDEIISTQFNYDQVVANSDTNIYSINIDNRFVIVEVIFEDNFTHMNLYDDTGKLIKSNSQDIVMKSYADCLWDGLVSRYQSTYGECIFNGKLGKCLEAGACTIKFLWCSVAYTVYEGLDCAVSN